MDRQAVIDALRRGRDFYMENVGNPARQVIGGGVRGYLGLDVPDYADALGTEVYRNAQALSNAPGVGAPAGAFKAMAAAPLIVRGALGAADKAKDGLTAAEKAWMTRMEKVARNKGVQHREAMRQGDTIVNDVVTINPRTIITPEDLLGKVGVQVQGDRSRAGAVIQALRGIPLQEGVKLEGGPAYTQLAHEMGTGGGWASMRGAAANKQRQIDRAAEMTGRDPVGVYSAMGLDGVNFSTPVAEAMIKQLRLLKPNKSSLVQADKEIRRAAPEFVGLQSPDALAQALGKEQFPMEGAGQVRKAIVNTLLKAEYQNQGFPVYDDIIDAVTQRDLKNVPIGASGFSMFRAMPGAGLIEKANVKVPHGSYDTVIPGQYMGGLAQSIPAEVMFPKIYERHRALGRNPQQTHRSLQMNQQDFEVFDQQWLDGVMEYLRKNGQ